MLYNLEKLGKKTQLIHGDWNENNKNKHGQLEKNAVVEFLLQNELKTKSINRKTK